MPESKILKNFFQAQHEKLLKRAYTLLQCTCGHHPVKSEYGEWLRRKGGCAAETPPDPPSKPAKEKRQHPRD